MVSREEEERWAGLLVTILALLTNITPVDVAAGGPVSETDTGMLLVAECDRAPTVCPRLTVRPDNWI